MSPNITTIAHGAVLVGALLACSTCSRILAPSQNSQVYIINSDGAGEIQLTKGLAKCYNPTFSPDGTEIIFESGSSPARSIFVVKTDGTDLRKLTQNAGDNSAPQISPDGGKIAFVSWRRDKGNRIFVMDSDGKNVEQLTRDSLAGEGFGCFSPEFSPDGNRLVFLCGCVGGNHGVRALDLSSKESKRITNEKSQHRSPMFSPDGKTVFYVVQPQPGDYQKNELHAVDSDGKNPRVIVASFNAIDAQYSLSPDGKTVAFARLSGLFVVNTDGAGERQITSNVGDPSYPTDLCPSFSFDSERIVFVSGMPGKRDLYIIKRDGTGRRRLTSKPGCYYSPEFSPDGKKIVFSASR